MSDVIANVTDVLAKATGSQAAAKDAIDKTEQDIKMAEDILKQVRSLYLSFKILSKVLSPILSWNTSSTSSGRTSFLVF